MDGIITKLFHLIGTQTRMDRHTYVTCQCLPRASAYHVLAKKTSHTRLTLASLTKVIAHSHLVEEGKLDSLVSTTYTGNDWLEL